MEKSLTVKIKKKVDWTEELLNCDGWNTPGLLWNTPRRLQTGTLLNCCNPELLDFEGWNTAFRY